MAAAALATANDGPDISRKPHTPAPTVAAATVAPIVMINEGNDDTDFIDVVREVILPLADRVQCRHEQKIPFVMYRHERWES
jgi:hypothetical protein